MARRKRVEGELMCEAVSDGKRMTRAALYAKQSSPLTVPVRELVDGEGIVLGFRQDMLSLSGAKGRVGGVETGAGLGTDAIVLTWKGRKVVIRGVELLRAWVETFAPEDAKLIEG